MTAGAPARLNVLMGHCYRTAILEARKDVATELLRKGLDTDPELVPEAQIVLDSLTPSVTGRCFISRTKKELLSAALAQT